MKSGFVTDEMVEDMRKLYFDDGLTLAEVSKRIGVSDKTVERHLKKKFKKIRSRSESLKGRPVTDKMREVARKLGKSQVGPKNPVWKGRVERSSGYVGVRKPDHPYASKDGYVMEHRLVMEEQLGRYLKPDEDVHHINHNKKDNRPENLMVISKSEHSKFHGLERVLDGTHNNYIPLSAEEIKREILKGGTMGEVAKRLNIDKTTLYNKIKKTGLNNWYKEWRMNA